MECYAYLDLLLIVLIWYECAVKLRTCLARDKVTLVLPVGDIQRSTIFLTTFDGFRAIEILKLKVAVCAHPLQILGSANKHLELSQLDFFVCKANNRVFIGGVPLSNLCT